MEKSKCQQVMAVNLILKMCNILMPFGIRAGLFPPYYEKSMSFASDEEGTFFIGFSFQIVCYII